MAVVPACRFRSGVRGSQEETHVELKKALYTLFAQYGTVLEIVACKQFSLRGQAWIVFDSITEASTAMQKLNDFVFYEKPMVRDPSLLIPSYEI